MWYDIDMKKLIVKTWLKERTTFDKQAEGIGMEISPVIWQHERIYLPHDFRPKMNYPRLVLRTEVVKTDEPAQYYLYLKRHIEDSGIDIVNFTPVGDYTEATGIVHQLGYRKLAEVSRQRQQVILDNKTKIYVDTVEGISGTFLKIELEAAEDAPVEKLRQEAYRTLKLLGQDNIVTQTYAELLNEDLRLVDLPKD